MPHTSYLIFARREFQEPLTQVGRIEVRKDTSVADAAKQEYGEKWLELVAIPEGRIAWAIRED